MIPNIKFLSDPPAIEVRFSDSVVVRQFSGEVLADVNRNGNWIRGLELLGSGIPFSLQRALSSLAPQFRSSPGPHKTLNVTYDEDANAAFLYLPYASPLDIERQGRTMPLLLKTSYTIGDENALFGLSADKTLVFIRFKIPSSENQEKFLELFQTRPS